MTQRPHIPAHVQADMDALADSLRMTEQEWHDMAAVVGETWAAAEAGDFL